MTLNIWDGIYIHPNIDARYAGLKIRDRIRQTKNEWKGTELPAKNMGKGLYKLFKAVVNELNNKLPKL